MLTICLYVLGLITLAAVTLLGHFKLDIVVNIQRNVEQSKWFWGVVVVVYLLYIYTTYVLFIK